MFSTTVSLPDILSITTLCCWVAPEKGNMWCMVDLEGLS